jgi:hypothetical protein
MLTQAIAERFAAIALGHLTREYPNKLDHLMAGDEDVRSPRDLHPIFYGSFDWHSCVHGHWLLAYVSRAFPQAPVSSTIEAVFARQYLPEKVAAELAYLQTPTSRGFERPYGWAWLLMLQAEMERREDKAWADRLRPLAEAFADRFKTWLPKADYPVRAGTHGNTAFALCLALDYARTCGDAALEALLGEKARAWYGNDRDCQAWEPSGDDFLSSTLIEAECVRRVLEPEAFRAWFAGFLPRMAEREPSTLFTPARVSDRSDGKIAHLDGLNLSRAWCWRGIASAVDGPARSVALDAATTHLDASLPHVAGDYMGEHWLASFALLALTPSAP